MPTLNLQVIASADDARQAGAGSVSVTGTTLVLSGSSQWFGLRFQSVAVPPKSTVLTATLRVYVDSTAADDPNVDIYAQAHDNAPAFTTTANDISNRARTTAKAAWSATAVGAGYGAAPSLASVLQEVINRPGWASGNSIALIFDALSASAFTIRAYDHTTTTFSATLDLEYSELAVPAPELSERGPLAIQLDDPQQLFDWFVAPLSENAAVFEDQPSIAATDFLGYDETDFAPWAGFLVAPLSPDLVDEPPALAAIAGLCEFSETESTEWGGWVAAPLGEDASSQPPLPHWAAHDDAYTWAEAPAYSYQHNLLAVIPPFTLAGVLVTTALRGAQAANTLQDAQAVTPRADAHAATPLKDADAVTTRKDVRDAATL